MGDAGMLLFGPVGRDVLAAGTVIFAVFGTGSQLIAGQTALASLSDGRLCDVLYTGLFAVPVLLFSLPRTLDRLSWLSVLAVLSILVAGLVGMVGAARHPAPGRVVDIVVASDSGFVAAFVSITNPVFAYAGHFMFFILISEMRDPRTAMRAAYALQGFATAFYLAFAAVTYWYLGRGVASPSFSSLPPAWAKAAYGLAIPNFWIAGSLYSHTAAKLILVRLFRGTRRTGEGGGDGGQQQPSSSSSSRHLHEHTVAGWAAWVALVLAANAAAFVLAVGVPIFNYLIGIAASLFASWYTYGIAGFFWLYDARHNHHHHDGSGSGSNDNSNNNNSSSSHHHQHRHHGGWGSLARSWPMATLCVLTILAGAFICVAGMYVTVDGIVAAYRDGTVSAPFSC